MCPNGKMVVPAEIAESLEIDRDKLRQQNELLLQVRERDKAKVESDSIVASCNCNAKTNDPQHHAKGCKYRLICERDDLARWKHEALLEKALSTPPPAVVPLDDVRPLVEALRPFGEHYKGDLSAIGGGTLINVQALVDQWIPFQAFKDAKETLATFTAKHPL